MKLNDNDRPWCPENLENYLCVLRQEQRPPRDLETFLDRQEELLVRLVAQADDAQLDLAAARIRQDLPMEEQILLQSEMFRDPETPARLLRHTANWGTARHEWMEDVPSALARPAMSAGEARQLAEGLSLESFLDRLLAVG